MLQGVTPIYRMRGTSEVTGPIGDPGIRLLIAPLQNFIARRHLILYPQQQPFLMIVLETKLNFIMIMLTMSSPSVSTIFPEEKTHDFSL